MKTDNLWPVALEEIIKKAKQKGADQIEVYLVEGRNLSVEIKGQKIEALEESVSSGYAIRVIKDQRLGFAYSNSMADIEDVLEKAIDNAFFVSPDEFFELPEPSGFYYNLDVFDPLIDGIKKEDLVKKCLELEDAALRADERIKKTRRASISLASVKKSIVNTRGIDFSYRSTSCMAQIMVVAEDGSDSQSAWEFSGSRFLKELSFKDIGLKAAKKALQLLGARRLSPRRAPVLFEPAVASEFLSLLASSFSAEEVLKGKSLLAGKIGERVFSPLINIIDNALLSGRLGSRPVDAEGINSKTNALIVKGVSEGYLHNTYTARKLGSQSTASATRIGYADLPHVGISNLYISPSEETVPLSFNDLIQVEREMLYVLDVMGMHTANTVTGDFSVGVSGLWIEKGEFLFPVKEVMIAGNVLELFRKVIALGDDLKFYGLTGSPHILFREVDISG